MWIFCGDCYCGVFLVEMWLRCGMFIVCCCVLVCMSGLYVCVVVCVCVCVCVCCVL